MDNFRALCSALVDAIDSESPFWEEELTSIADLARAALAEPVPPAEGEVAELVEWLRLEAEDWSQANPSGYQGARLTRAADLLEQHHPAPVPVPAEGEVAELVAELRMMASQAAEACQFTDAENLSRAADLLEQHHPAPVPVSERLPGPEDCDAEGRCWWFLPTQQLEILRQSDAWSFRRHTPRKDDYCLWTHWLPATALPLPAGEVEQ